MLLRNIGTHLTLQAAIAQTLTYNYFIGLQKYAYSYIHSHFGTYKLSFCMQAFLQVTNEYNTKSFSHLQNYMQAMMQ